MKRPVVTLLTDFGTRDAYVGILKGEILARSPEAQLVDLTHEIDPQDVLGGALILESAWSSFPKGTVHLAVVDPGVGSDRRPIVIRTRAGFFVGPDNGLLSLAAARAGNPRAVVLDRLGAFGKGVGKTFHGRDVFAPVAGHLAAGVALSRFGSRIPDPLTLAWPAPGRRSGRVIGEVVHIDRFGNLLTNLRPDDLGGFLASDLLVSIAKMRVRGVSDHYAAVPAGRLVALWNSWGRLEIALRDGSAAKRLGVLTGDRVEVSSRLPR